MGRVAKYKKVKKFDLHNEKSDAFDRAPRKKDKVKVPNSFRTMKMQKDRMERIERLRTLKKHEQQNKSKESKEISTPPKPKIQVS